MSNIIVRSGVGYVQRLQAVNASMHWDAMVEGFCKVAGPSLFCCRRGEREFLCWRRLDNYCFGCRILSLIVARLFLDEFLQGSN